MASLLVAGPGALCAQEDSRGAAGVFTPSPPPLVQSEDIEPRRLDIDLTGRTKDVFPRIDGNLSIEIQNTMNVKSDDRDREINDLTTSDDMFLALRLAPGLSVQSGLVLEDVKDPQPGENRYFGDTGAFVETLGLYYQPGDVGVFGGKINPTFGVAWDLAPGIYGTDLADDYELTERVGVGGSVTMGGGEAGKHTLTVQTFFLDTSILSQSWGTQRGRTRRTDGGVGNTESFQSLSATLDGAVPRTDGLRYQLGLERQQAGMSQPDSEQVPDSERGVAAALYGGFELAEETELRPIVEWARLKNREGEPNTVDYVTVGAGLFFDPWNVAVSWTGRVTDPRDEAAYTDRLFQLSAGYEFDDDITINIGWGYIEDENVASHVIGVLLLYDLDFSIH